MKRLVFLVLMFAYLLFGCGPAPLTYYVNVDSIGAPDTLTRRKYVLLSGLKDVDPTDLQFQEYSTHVERALTSMGCIRAET